MAVDGRAGVLQLVSPAKAGTGQQTPNRLTARAMRWR